MTQRLVWTVGEVTRADRVMNVINKYGSIDPFTENMVHYYLSIIEEEPLNLFDILIPQLRADLQMESFMKGVIVGMGLEMVEEALESQHVGIGRDH